MNEFSNTTKNLLIPSKDGNISGNLEKIKKINSILGDLIKISITNGYKWVCFTIPDEYIYIKKEALQNIMSNLLAEGFIHSQDNFQPGFATMPSKSFAIYRYIYNCYDCDYNIQSSTTLEYATSIKIKF